MEIQIDTITVQGYRESDRCKQLKAEVWKQASAGKQFDIKELTPNEWCYFRKLYELYCQVADKKITSEAAAEQDKKNYMRFEFDETIREQRIADVAEWQQNIKKTELLRTALATSIVSGDMKSAVLALAEMVQVLTKDTTVLPSVKEMLEVEA